MILYRATLDVPQATAYGPEQGPVWEHERSPTAQAPRHPHGFEPPTY
jgi:hypothetical protein